MSERGIVSDGTHATTVEGLSNQFVYDTVVSSSGTTVFEDFERADPLAVYEGDLGTFSDNTTDPFEGSHALTLDGTAGGSLIYRSDKTIAEDGTTYSYRVKKADGNIEGVGLVANGGSATGFQDYTGYFLETQWAPDGNLVINKIDGDGTTDPLATGPGTDTSGWSESLYHWIDITVGGTDDFLIERYENAGSGKPDTPADSVSANDSTYSGFVLGWVHIVTDTDPSSIDFMQAL